MLVWFLIYKISTKFLYAQSLSWTHAVITVTMIAIFIDSGQLVFKWAASSDLESGLLRQLMINKQRQVDLGSVVGLFLLIGQLVYPLNLAMGLVRKKNRTSTPDPAST
jgi:hypothetical protein